MVAIPVVVKTLRCLRCDSRDSSAHDRRRMRRRNLGSFARTAERRAKYMTRTLAMATLRSIFESSADQNATQDELRVLPSHVFALLGTEAHGRKLSTQRNLLWEILGLRSLKHPRLLCALVLLSLSTSKTMKDSSQANVFLNSFDP